MQMQAYKGSSGCGVSSFGLGSDFIAVEFKTGAGYLDTYGCPEKLDVEAMKKLAIAGSGLATYIGQNVKERFREKLA